MKRRLGVPMLAVLAVPAVLVGCGGGGSHKVSASQYVTSVCTATVKFENTMNTQSQQLKARDPEIFLAGLTAGLTGGQKAGLDRVKTDLETFLGNVESAAKTWQKAIHSAGAPDVSNGSHLASAFSRDVDKFVAASETFRTEAGKVPTSSPAAFERGVRDVATKYQSSAQNALSNMSSLNSPELQAAAAKVAACRSA